MKNIAVIGAGMAGLACAQTLQEAGFLVTVFDKSRGPSGRVSTRQGEGWQCDHGAQYFTVSTAPFAAQMDKWLQAGVVTVWQGRLFETDGQQLKPKAGHKQRFVGVPKNTAPARQMAERLTVELEQTIEQIQQVDGVWQVRSKEHGIYPQGFDQVILAIPAPQAAALLPMHASFQALAANVKMRGCWAMMARYSKPLVLPFDGLFVNHGPLSWVARDSSKPGRLTVAALPAKAERAHEDSPQPAQTAVPESTDAVNEVWSIHASAEWSEAHLEDPPETVTAAMIEAFVALGGTTPTAVSVHRWRYADCAPPLTQGYAWDAAQCLGLCGDWLNGGKVEGAWMSGYLLAQAITQHYPQSN